MHWGRGSACYGSHITLHHPPTHPTLPPVHAERPPPLHPISHPAAGGLTPGLIRLLSLRPWQGVKLASRPGLSKAMRTTQRLVHVAFTPSLAFSPRLSLSPSLSLSLSPLYSLGQVPLPSLSHSLSYFSLSLSFFPHPTHSPPPLSLTPSIPLLSHSLSLLPLSLFNPTPCPSLLPLALSCPLSLSLCSNQQCPLMVPVSVSWLADAVLQGQYLFGSHSQHIERVRLATRYNSSSRRTERW